MPSFDAVNEVNLQEVDNALHQAMKEIQQRFDFKNSKTNMSRENNLIKVLSDDDSKMKSVLEIFKSKAVKRGVDLKALEVGKTEPGPGGLVKCEIKLLEGIDTENAKKITRMIKDSKLKVQAAIQDNQVRVTGKKKDDLQEAMGIMQGMDLPLPLQFKNFRD